MFFAKVNKQTTGTKTIQTLQKSLLTKDMKTSNLLNVC